MRFAISTVIYNDHRFIKPFVKQLPEYIEKILLLVSKNPWHGKRSEDDHKTLEIIASINDPRIECIVMDWRTEEIQRSWGLARLYEYDWVFTLDTDEFFTPVDWDVLKAQLENAPITANVAKCGMETYWKDFDHVWRPIDMHKPTIAVKPKKCCFFDKRETPEGGFLDSNALLHHLSWVRTDKEVWQKIQNYMHAVDFDLEEWYNNVWKAWTPPMTNLRPYGTEGRTRAAEMSLPSQIRELFEEPEKG